MDKLLGYTKIFLHIFRTRLAVLFWGFSHQSKGDVFIDPAKNEDQVSCRAESHLAQRGMARKFFKSKTLYRGGKLGIFSSPRAFIEGVS